MKLCVGACSRVIIEEAARLQVPQIIASRRQVDVGGGYTGLDQYGLVDLVNTLSGGQTKVVRDHGGPLQGGHDDDGIASLKTDVDANFDYIHIDVCLLPKEEQLDALENLVRIFDEVGNPFIEVGDEHAPQAWNDTLIGSVIDALTLRTAVISVGTYIWEDRQSLTQSAPMPPRHVAAVAKFYRKARVATKAHNMDWLETRNDYEPALDYCNIAPEFGAVEIDAILDQLQEPEQLLQWAYETGAWRRWYTDPGYDVTSLRARAKTALRYLRSEPTMLEHMSTLGPEDMEHVREKVRDAIAAAM